MSGKARTYRVVGIHAIFGNPPGSTFTAVIPPAQEKALIAGRGLVRVQAPERVNLTKPKKGKPQGE